MQQATVKVNHPTGLHFRPAGLFVHTAKRFSSAVTVSCATGEADAKNIHKLISLQVMAGTEITIRCDGPDESEALGALVELVNNNFPGI